MADPKRIYLQSGECAERTWCEDRIEPADTAYIRADIADRLQAIVDKLRACIRSGHQGTVETDINGDPCFSWIFDCGLWADLEGLLAKAAEEKGDG